MRTVGKRTQEETRFYKVGRFEKRKDVFSMGPKQVWAHRRLIGALRARKGNWGGETHGLLLGRREKTARGGLGMIM